MLVYLVKDGTNKVLELNISRDQYHSLIKNGYRRPTANERYNHALELKKIKKNKVAELMFSHPDLLDVFFIAPKNNLKDGYGNTARQIERELMDQSVFLNRNFNNQRIGFCYNYPYALERMKTPYKILYTMFESTRMPEDWGHYLNMANEIIVPSKFCALVMERQFGIRPKVIPLGFDRKNFTYINRPRQKVFTFLHYDAFKLRKGWDLVFKAFNQAFIETDKVKLIFKTTREKTLPLSIEYPKIEIEKGEYPDRKMIQLLEKANCFVYPSRGEGFGLPPIEAMATGIPAIISNSSGMNEYFDEKFVYGVKHKLIPAKYDNENFKGMDLGSFAQASVNDLAKKMRLAYDDYKLKRGPYSQSGGRRISNYQRTWDIFKGNCQKFSLRRQ